MTDPLNQLRPTEVVDGPGVGFATGLRTRIDAVEARDRRNRSRWHLAQLNLGRFRAPLDAPEMAPFATALDRINALAEASPGFVWRLTDDAGGSSSNLEVPGTDDPLVASNLSVWTDMESLRAFMYRTDHGAYLRRRREWFSHTDEAMNVLWWVPVGTIPTLAEAVERLDFLRRNGPSHTGWPLARTVPPPPVSVVGPVRPAAGFEAAADGGADGASPVADSLIPYLTVGDARAAIAFYREVFGADSRGEIVGMADGRVGHAELTIGGHVVYLADEFPEMGLLAPAARGGPSVSMVVAVDDCDAVYHHALAAGAIGQRPPTDERGERAAWFVDPWGHRWRPSGPLRR